jgi:hypothetical protein
VLSFFVADVRRWKLYAAFDSQRLLRSITRFSNCNVSLQPTHPHQILLMLIPRKIALPRPPLHRQPIPPVFRHRRPQIAQFVELLLLSRRESRPRCNRRVSRSASEGDGLPPRGAVRIVAIGLLTAAETAAKVAAEEDAEGWCGGAHDADLEFELGPDEEHESRADHVAGVAGHCGGKRD